MAAHYMTAVDLHTDMSFPLCCCCSSLINSLILQALWMQKHFCHIALPSELFSMPSPWEWSTWTWLWWHSIILPVNPIRMPDLLECQWARSPWSHRQLKRHNGLVELCGMQCVGLHVFVCVCGFMPVCIKPLAQQCLRMCLYSFVGVHLSVVATGYLHLLNQIHLKVKYFLWWFIYDVVRRYI